MSTTQYTQAELTAKKVPELKTILGTLKLSQIGVKADLVTRILEEQQKQGGIEGKTDLGAASNALGDIPSEDKLPSLAGEADAPAASAVTDAPQSTSVEGDASAEVAGATETGATAEGGDAPDTSAADAFGADLPTPEGTTKESEAQKRAKRLERFGGNEAELEKLQRAERFGTSVVDDSTVTKLDSELSNKRIRKNDGAAAKPAKAQSKDPAPKASTNGNARNGRKSAPSSKAPVTTFSAEEEEKRQQRLARFNKTS